MTQLRRTARVWARLVLTTAFIAAASNAAAQTIATLESSVGEVTVLRLGQPQPAKAAMPLQLNDIVVTRQGRASVRFDSDGTVLRVGPESRVQIDESATERDIKLFFGRIWAHVIRWKERPTRFSSGSTIAAIRGTELSLAVASDGNETQLAVLEGRVEAKTDTGNPITLQGGQTATGAKGRAVALGARVRPQDAVQWALYYPPVLFAKPGAPETAGQRAAAQLAAGSVEAAVKELDAALAKNPNDSDALALKAVVAVAANRADEAASTAQKAIAANPKSAAAQVALSYAQQAKFDLGGARASLEKAVQLEPGDALAWARLAEIRSSLGEADASLAAARKAAELEPSLSRAQTVLGFSHLARVDTAQATAAFRKAIELDASDPLPRLGLGLTQIREGALAEGTKELETAVSLDPGQATVRSYLGKAYFEQKRVTLVDREFDLAKQADPKDPTPWLYDAINKQTTNRPVEALEANQKAIELNDNRGVYRSRLLLDSDLAARSAALGRIYADLGFQDRALVEGWSSVNTDSTNYSAHRFLADSYASLPRHEIARVSELLQSQMLQPLNTTAIQPRLGESNLLLISEGGPGSLAFNEFNPLFSRNGVSFQGSGLLGENGLGSGEGVLAGIYNKLSFSVGYNQFQTDGWRENASQDDKIANVFLQLEVTPATSLQAEYRYRDQQYGDLQQKFYADAFLPGEHHDVQRDTYRFGGRHAFSPASVLLASFIYLKSDEHVTVDGFFGPDTSLASTYPQDAYGVEVQHLYRSRYFNLTTGVGYFNIDGEIRLTLDFFGSVEEQPAIPTKFDHVNAYTYANIKPVKNVILTAGASYDHLNGDLPEGGGDQFNPKVGLTWNPTPTTTLRASAFRTLKRTLITDQTLEPTQVSGFNQFYDEADLTKSWRYGGAIDQKFGRKAFAGAEYSQRDLTVPLTRATDGVLVKADWQESLGRAYLFASPHPWVGLKAQYIREHFDRELGLGLGVHELTTYRVPLGIGFFHPSGISATATTTYWNQEGQLETFLGSSTELQTASSNFWLVDAAVNYRLPKRYGVLSVGATNLFDKDFQYFENDIGNVTIQPKRTIFAKITLAVP